MTTLPVPPGLIVTSVLRGEILSVLLLLFISCTLTGAAEVIIGVINRPTVLTVRANTLDSRASFTLYSPCRSIVITLMVPDAVLFSNTLHNLQTKTRQEWRVFVCRVVAVLASKYQLLLRSCWPCRYQLERCWPQQNRILTEHSC